MIVGEALDVGAKADCLAMVPHARMAVVGIQEPAETVGGGLIVGADGTAIWDVDRRERRLHFLFAEERVMGEGVIPLGQVVQGRVDTTVAQSCGGGVLVRFYPGVPLLRMPVSAIRNFVSPFDVGYGVTHAEWGEDAIVEELRKRFVGDARDDVPQKDIAGIAVCPSCAWLKLCSRELEEGEDAGVANLGLFVRRRIWLGLRH